MIKIFEGFAGYGGASFGLTKANVEFECVGYSEIDKGAIKCYEQNHKGKNYGDITKINPNDLPDFDLFTGGFPCQDVSVAGDRDLSKGRTNLYLEIIRIVSVKKPKYLLLENVKGLLSMEIDEGKLIDKIVRDLQKIGYGVAWKVLNSKDYGIPQNRERVWFVCKLGGWNFMEFMFPEKEELKIKLKDILEIDVDKKYYLNEKWIKQFQKRKDLDVPQPNLLGLDDNETAATITTKAGGRYQDNFVIKTRDVEKAIDIAIELSNKEKKPVQLDMYHLQYGELRPLSTYIPQNLDEARCLQAGEPKEVLVEARSRFKYDELNDCSDISITLRGDKGRDILVNRVRKLTPKECFRLMGFLDDGINLDGLSDTQKYKLAGNGWDINLVSKIFKRMKL